MDSLSQIVLGAAVGEAVLGRRIGNRAMVWGAVAGTIPDMDVLGKYFLSELDNLAFHRGISHSLLFCVVGALGFGWVTDRMYRSLHHARIAMATKAAAAVLVGFVVNFLTQIVSPGGWIPLVAVHPAGRAVVVAARPEALLQRELDCAGCGPQRVGAPVLLGLPDAHAARLLHDLRHAAVCAVLRHPGGVGHHCGGGSAVDVPFFLACLLVAARFARSDRGAPAGMGLALRGVVSISPSRWSTMGRSRGIRVGLEAEGKPHEQLFITPTIFNNLLWNAVVEDGDGYLLAQYSILDEVPIAFHRVEKGWGLLHNLETDETLRCCVGSVRAISTRCCETMDRSNSMTSGSAPFPGAGSMRTTTSSGSSSLTMGQTSRTGSSAPKAARRTRRARR